MEQTFEFEDSFESVEAFLTVFRKLDEVGEPGMLSVRVPPVDASTISYPNEKLVAQLAYKFAIENIERVHAHNKTQITIRRLDATN